MAQNEIQINLTIWLRWIRWMMNIIYQLKFCVHNSYSGQQTFNSWKSLMLNTNVNLKMWNTAEKLLLAIFVFFLSFFVLLLEKMTSCCSCHLSSVLRKQCQSACWQLVSFKHNTDRQWLVVYSDSYLSNSYEDTVFKLKTKLQCSYNREWRDE